MNTILTVIISFHNTTAAVQMQRAATAEKLPGVIIPVPRDMSASCGMAWCAPAECETAVRALLREREIPYQAVAVRPYRVVF